MGTQPKQEKQIVVIIDPVEAPEVLKKHLEQTLATHLPGGDNYETRTLHVGCIEALQDWNPTWVFAICLAIDHLWTSRLLLWLAQHPEVQHEIIYEKIRVPSMPPAKFRRPTDPGQFEDAVFTDFCLSMISPQQPS